MWQLSNIKIHYVVPLYVEVVIGFKFKGLNEEIMFTLANNTDYFGCDYRTCYFMCAIGFTFWSVVVGRPRWSDMEGPCHLPNVDGQMDPSLAMVQATL
jgi:hypothetical protein